MLLIHHPDLSEKELKVCGTIISTMWDFHCENAMYDEVVARELPYEYFVPKEELPPGIFGNEKIFLFTKEKEVQEVIGSLVARRVFEDREIEFLFGLEDSQIARMVRVLTFTQKELYNELNTLRVKLGVYY